MQIKISDSENNNSFQVPDNSSHSPILLDQMQNPRSRGVLRWMFRRCIFVFSIVVMIIVCFTLLNADIDSIIDTVFDFSDYDDESATQPSKQVLPSKPETIHMAVVGCKGPKKDSVGEALNMLKSAILFTQLPIHFHIFTDVGEEFQTHLHSLPSEAKQRFTFQIRDIKYPLAPEEISEYRDWWGPCASFRLFLPEVMVDQDAVIYVDSDVLFLGPVDDLWNEFKNFNSEQAVGLAPRAGWHFHLPANNQNFIMTPQGKVTQVNSGVFLMNLTRMREPVFRTNSQVSLDFFTWNKDLFFPLYHKFKSDMYGDQNLITIIFHYNPHLIYYFDCRYNYHHKFCFDKDPERWCNAAEREGAIVVHGSAKTFYNNYSPAFKAINDAFQQYKFQDDLNTYLVMPMERNLRNPTVENHEHCGGKTELFMKNVRKSVEKYPSFHRK